MRDTLSADTYRRAAMACRASGWTALAVEFAAKAQEIDAAAEAEAGLLHELDRLRSAVRWPSGKYPVSTAAMNAMRIFLARLRAEGWALSEAVVLTGEQLQDVRAVVMDAPRDQNIPAQVADSARAAFATGGVIPGGSGDSLPAGFSGCVIPRPTTEPNLTGPWKSWQEVPEGIWYDSCADRTTPYNALRNVDGRLEIRDNRGEWRRTILTDAEVARFAPFHRVPRVWQNIDPEPKGVTKVISGSCEYERRADGWWWDVEAGQWVNWWGLEFPVTEVLPEPLT